MGRLDGEGEASERTVAGLSARSRSATNWDTLCQDAPWGQVKNAPNPPAALNTSPVVAADASGASPAPQVAEDYELPPVVHHSLFEAFDTWSQTEGAASAVEPAPRAPASCAGSEPVEARSSGGVAAFYAWVETEGGLSATGLSASEAEPAAAPVDADAGSEPVPAPETAAVSEPPPVLAPVLVSVSLEPAPAARVAEPIQHEALSVAPVLVAAPVPEEVPTPKEPPKAVDPTWAAPKPPSRSAVDAATIEALAAEVVPMVARPAPLGAPVPPKAPPPKAKAQGQTAASRRVPVPSLFSVVRTVAARAIKGAGFGAGPPLKRPAAPAAKVPARPKPVVQRLLGAVEREVGIAFGAIKNVGSGLVRQARAVVAPVSGSKPAPKKRPASAARGK